MILHGVRVCPTATSTRRQRSWAVPTQSQASSSAAWRRLPTAGERANELDERAVRGEGTEEDAVESLHLMWPPYFVDPSSAPAMPPMHFCVPAYAGLYGELVNGLPELEQALPGVEVPVGIAAGAKSPMPVTFPGWSHRDRSAPR